MIHKEEDNPFSLKMPFSCKTCGYNYNKKHVAEACERGHESKIQEQKATEILKILRKRDIDTGDFQRDFEANQTPRLAAIDEIKRRGAITFLKEAGWGFTKADIYKNRYTATEQSLGEMFEDDVYNGCNHYKTFEEWLEHEAPYLCESWLPKGSWVEDECFSEYLLKIN